MGWFHSQRCRTIQISPFLSHGYLTKARSLQTDHEVDVIDVGHSNTVRTLRDQLARLDRGGYTATGFPILSTDETGKSRMLGFIGGNELEHALSTLSSIWLRIYGSPTSLIWDTSFPGIVAEDANYPVSFLSESGPRFGTISSTSISSVIENAEDPFNFSVYMDKVLRSANFGPTFYSSRSCRLR